MTTIAPGGPAAPEPTSQVASQAISQAADRSHRAPPRTTPDGDLMPGQDAAADGPELGFGDLLDVINPLQHLPVVGTIYRALTGDTINDAARMAGGALYGGPFGLVGALANVVFQRENGQDLGDTAMAWLNGGPDAADGAGTAVADAAQAVPATQAQPINAAPVTIAAANASPAALAARAGNPEDRGAAAAAPESPGGRATTSFQGRSADRLDAFIQQAGAVRRDNPLALARRSGPAVIDSARLQAAALRPPGIAEPGADRPKAEPELALAGGDAGSVNEWMLRALDKYEHLRGQEQS